MEEKNNKMTLDKLAEMTQMGFVALEDKIENEISELRDEFKNDLRNEIGGLRSELKNEISEKFDLVLTGQNQILKRSVDLETDNVMSAAVHRRQDDKLEDHEERIIVVEEKVLV
ncbi:MAG: hypothetical protein KAQ87_05370 [Candidatus Pacebacteria bacterium]|nr:hypothetical protein [Candidatus Paceibacterota bacterium]